MSEIPPIKSPAMAPNNEDQGQIPSHMPQTNQKMNQLSDFSRGILEAERQ